jgi:hypothetical protein
MFNTWLAPMLPNNHRRLHHSRSELAMSPIIPASSAELTASTLTSLLHESGALDNGTDVVSVRVEPLQDVMATFGQLIRVRLDYSGQSNGLPSTMIAKLPTANEGSSASMRASGGYMREVNFYRSMAASSGMRTPACFAAALDADSNFILLLEDLAHLTHVHEANLSAAQIESVVRALAVAHAAWWADPRLPGMTWLGDLTARIDVMLDRFVQAWPLVSSELAADVAGMDQFGLEMANRYAADAEQGSTEPITLLHTDVRASNLFFEESPEGPSPVFIDFQTLRRGRGPVALAQFMAFAPGRATLEDRLLDVYYEGLTAAGVTHYSREECDADYFRGLLRRLSSVTGAVWMAGRNTQQGADIMDLLATFDFSTLGAVLARVRSRS